MEYRTRFIIQSVYKTPLESVAVLKLPTIFMLSSCHYELKMTSVSIKRYILTHSCSLLLLIWVLSNQMGSQNFVFFFTKWLGHETVMILTPLHCFWLEVFLGILGWQNQMEWKNWKYAWKWWNTPEPLLLDYILLLLGALRLMDLIITEGTGSQHPRILDYSNYL